jgi:hypothetical protein
MSFLIPTVHGTTFESLELQDEEGNTLVVPGLSSRDTKEEERAKMDKAAAEYEEETGESPSIVLMERRYLEWGTSASGLCSGSMGLPCCRVTSRLRRLLR